MSADTPNKEAAAGPAGPWIDLIGTDQIAPGAAATVVVGGRPYAVCNDSGRFHVVDNTCPHAGGSLGEGVVAAGQVICPWHHFEWDLRTGLTTDPWPTRLAVHPCKVENGRVLALLGPPIAMSCDQGPLDEPDPNGRAGTGQCDLHP